MIKRLIFILAFSSVVAVNAQKNEPQVVQNLKTDISYLSSEQLQGRLAGSPQDKMAAEYIAEEFKKAGLKPYNGQTFQTFDIVQLRIATNKTIFELHFPNADTFMKTKMVLFRDFYPVSESGMNDSAFGLTAFCGYGIEAPGLGINSYQNLTDLKGKIFLIMLGFPGDDTAQNSPLAPYADLGSKIETAIKYGAAGVVFTRGGPKADVPKGELQRNAKTYPIPVIFLNKELYPRINMYVKMRTAIAAPSNKAYNVMGYRNNHKKNTIIICAHHDHLGHNEFGNSLYTGKDLQVHNGADDNASGVAAMLQLARTLKGRKYKKNNYLFIGFSGEEMGLLGSKSFLNQNIIPKNSINYVINIDMLGRLDSQSKTLVVNGTGTSSQWEKSIKSVKNDSTVLHIVTSASGLGPSDHASFYLDSIPVLHFFSGQHADYHKPSDDESKINYHGMYLSVNYIQKIVASANKAGKINYIKTKDAAPGRRSFKVTMGVMPDYTYTENGMRIDGVTDGKPAQIAGLQRGDIITKIEGFSINSVQDYMRVLQTLNKGQKIKVEIIRNKETKILEVAL